jgi:hypothetical protein
VCFAAAVNGCFSCAVVVTEAYLSAAEYKSAECKYTEVYGIDTNLNLGGGAQQFTFRRSTQASRLRMIVAFIQTTKDC